ncbi:MAG TPA: LptF/LptG family permease, partial [Anaerohalosphaeraceae bacterium]|nr:LptF/LptG family permease [Anaerohalosphaeraceae bacterium]
NSPLVSPSKPLLERIRQLQVELAEVNDEIDAELHSRLVMGLGCVSLILTGIALGVYYRGGHLLSAFGASAVPGGFLVLFIMSGKQITKNPSTTAMMGITVMWMGLAILTLLTVYLYRRLLKT